ncbi:MAG: 3-hydroxyacyl-ACP dehydratase FabZ family protein [Cyclobacteriaceae bacterium]
MNKEEIIKNFPVQKPYRYIDDIISLSEEEIVGSYRFKDNEYFYEGHFPGDPITPGAILQESAAQIGLLAFGMHLLGSRDELNIDAKFFLGSSDLKFLGVVKPGDQIIVSSKLLRFRFNTIKCKISITSTADQVVCKGTMTGFVQVKT